VAVGIKLGQITDEIGSPSFFAAFFSTICGNLEPRGWGSRFPLLMNRLYQGELNQSQAANALTELQTIRAELADIPPAAVIWDIEDRSQQPPWGSEISEDITDLSNYFVTSTGRDLIGVLEEVLVELRDAGGVAQIVAY
jgi:hypothetical protein